MRFYWPFDRRRSLLISIAAVAVLTLLALYLLGTALFTVGLSVVLAYMLLPVIRLIERAMPWRERRPGLSRLLSIALIYLLAIAIFAGTLLWVVPSTVEESQQFAEEFPDLWVSVRENLEDLISLYTDEIPEGVRDSIQQSLANAGGLVGEVAWSFVSKTVSTVSSSFGLILGLATAPVLIFGLLKDPARIRASLYAPFPPDLQAYLRTLLEIAERTMGRYIRGQISLGLIVGVAVTLALLLMGVPYAFVLGLVAGLTELVPIMGPWVGGAFGVLVTLAVAPEKALWVAALYVAVQLIENTVLVNRIQGHALRIHPVWMTVIVVVSATFFGVWGIILGPPVVALVRDVAAWVTFEWNRPEREAAMSVATEAEAGDEDGEPEV